MPTFEHYLAKQPHRQSALAKAAPANIAALMQVLTLEHAWTEQGLVDYLQGTTHADATRALARLAIFSQETVLGKPAVKRLQEPARQELRGYPGRGTGLPGRPWRAAPASAIAKLKLTDLVPRLIDQWNGSRIRALRGSRLRARP